MALPVEKWVRFGSAMAGFGLLWSRMPEHVHGEARSIISSLVPIHDEARRIISSLVPMALSYLLWSRMPEHVHDEARRIISSLVPMGLMSYFNPYEQITIAEYGEGRYRRNQMFDAVSTYLTKVCLDGARKLKAELGNSSKDDPLYSLDENQEVVDNFEGAPMWWRLCPKSPKKREGTVVSLFAGESNSDEPRLYRLVFHKRHRQRVLRTYLPMVVKQWHEEITKKRQRQLFTNHSQDGKSVWTGVPYNPPATFKTLAMDKSKKDNILADLTAFREAKEYHSKVGKAWKRGYLLYGPPGTGKSTIIGAMANFLKYDVFDLDLTSIRSNAELRKLFLDTTNRSIIVIEDIDAIEVELTTNRKGNEAAEEKGDKRTVIELSDAKDKGNVTLSGLLNFVDGLWSACGYERVFVFTTNHVDRLDPALIRRGRMDRHIELSYCRFEAFEMLAKSYLDITEHSLFDEIRLLLGKVDITPADVADHLMPRGNDGEFDRLLEERNLISNHMRRAKKKREADECLAGLVEALKKAKIKSATPPMDSMEEAKEQ